MHSTAQARTGRRGRDQDIPREAEDLQVSNRTITFHLPTDTNMPSTSQLTQMALQLRQNDSANVQIATKDHSVDVFVQPQISHASTSPVVNYHNDDAQWPEAANPVNFEQETQEMTLQSRLTGLNRPTDTKAPRIFCEVEGCVYMHGQRSSFARKADLQRHMASVHAPQRLGCPWPKCTRRGSNGFARKDHLTEHIRGYHDGQLPGGNTVQSKRRY